MTDSNPTTPESFVPVRNLLAIDGGGLFGLISARYAEALEDRLDRLAIRDGVPTQPLHRYFDLVAGTSTGSIIAAGIATGMPATELVKLYRDEGKVIFPRGLSANLNSAWRFFTDGPSRPTHDDAGLMHILKKHLRTNGIRVTFSDLDRNVRTMIPAYDTIRREAWVFKSWRPYLSDVEVWPIVKGSCSAPTYLPAHAVTLDVPVASKSGTQRRDFSLIDGGVWANNPAAAAVAEAITLNQGRVEPGELNVVSIGNVESPGRAIPARKARRWGRINWIINADIINVMMDGSHETASYIASSIVGAPQFHRFSARSRDESLKMDDPAMLDQIDSIALAALGSGRTRTLLDRTASRLHQSARIRPPSPETPRAGNAP